MASSPLSHIKGVKLIPIQLLSGLVLLISKQAEVIRFEYLRSVPLQIFTNAWLIGSPYYTLPVLELCWIQELDFNFFVHIIIGKILHLFTFFHIIIGKKCYNYLLFHIIIGKKCYIIIGKKCYIYLLFSHDYWKKCYIYNDRNSVVNDMSN